MTVIGPLTTTFRQPASCTTTAPQIYQVFADDKSYNFTQGPLFPASSSCFPSGYNASPTNYYSPGFCPYGYTAACSSLNQVKTETETAVICCPTYVGISI
ncbi:hypothetical protein B0T26DRAFT_654838 [Lasiosphaeria miniovina]|uniref:Uncharacterized protein n=1 Tax=Lasiosphaeria miniovina TaxID=1954250 RepID=A0AA39ZZU8_9PEZI|nr:uncharacterized protein B0T26DRAFT_654838 [Lasiosphaeria miniovina]KAK0706620.1 hypothetical protein B0T26DRAFT_654838 [Lasiosphaeria miniovina]